MANCQTVVITLVNSTSSFLMRTKNGEPLKKFKKKLIKKFKKIF